MRNNTVSYYRVGGLTFCFDAPDFREDTQLSLFRTDPAPADVTCRVRFSPELTAPEGQWLTRNLLEGFCRTEGGVARVLFRESGEGLLMTDLPREWGREVTIHQSQAEYWGTNLALRALDLPRRVIPLGGVFLHVSGDGFVGGITYMVNFPDIAPGEKAELNAAHYTTAGSRIVFVTYAE